MTDISTASQGPDEDWSKSLYNELRVIAARQLAKQPPGQTLQATALVHEAWLKLGASQQRWKNRGHFFAAAAQAMRQILIDQARRKAALKHGGGQPHTEFDESVILGGAPDDQLLAVNDALDRLEAHDPIKAQVVKLRYYMGLTLDAAAAVLEISKPTASRHWAYARAWLFRELKRS